MLRYIIYGITVIFIVTSMPLQFRRNIKTAQAKQLSSRNIYGDRSADTVLKMMRQTVKIQEDIIIENISGLRRNIESATTGSGVVIAVRNKKSLVLTAEHVCTTLFNTGKVLAKGRYIVRRSKKVVITSRGKKLSARVYEADPITDSCIMEVDGIAGHVATLSSFYPPIGAKIMTSGAPAGWWDKNLVNVVEGRYIGLRTKPIRVNIFISFNDFLQYSLPIVGGMSGSAVYYKGRFFGLITLGTSRYEHIGWGPGLKQLAPLIKKTLKVWDPQKTNVE